MKSSVSVIIPTYNEEKYLKPTLQSIRNQDYQGQYEVIISDSGSTDQTLEIAEQYADKIVEIKKRGIGVGRNAGAKEAQGGILIFVDADTLLLYNALSEIMHPFDDKEIVGVAVPVFPLSPKGKDILLFLWFNEFVRINVEFGKGRARIVGSCCGYRKSVFDEVGGFNEKLAVLEDFDLSRRISRQGKIKYIQETMALVSTRRIAKWGRRKSVERYISMYLKQFFNEKGLKTNTKTLDSYHPIR